MVKERNFFIYVYKPFDVKQRQWHPERDQGISTEAVYRYICTSCKYLGTVVSDDGS